MCDVRCVQVLGYGLAGVVIAITASAAQAADAQATQATRIDQAQQRALDPKLQPELPRYRTDGRPGAGALDGSQGGRGPRRAGELVPREHNRAMVDTRERQQSGPIASLLSFLLWGVVVVAVSLGAFWLASELAKLGGDPDVPLDPTEPSGPPVDTAIIERPLGDADELARRGEFAEAIHTLLLRTLQELVRSAAVKVAPAMTSREILARVPLLADAREALAGLITAVEITYFGDEPANAADYERCRQQFHVFAQAFRNSGYRSSVAA